MSPQWRTINSTASANGISNLTYLTTIDKYTYSENKINASHIGDITNKGNISGDADATTGSKGTLTTIRASATGNGVSSAAYSNSFVKARTEATIGKIKNEGEIRGRVRAVVGTNTSIF